MKTFWVAVSLSLFSVLALAQDSAPITKSDPPGSIQWTQYGFLPTHTSFNSHETILTRANVASLTFQWAAEGGPGIASAPVVGQGIVYAAADGMIFAFRASDGKPLWSHLSCSGVDSVQPALGPHALLVGDGGGDLAAYNPVTGEQIWCDDLGGSITSAPAVDEKTVYITNGSDVVALDQLTGTGRWRFTPSDFPVTSTPAVFDGVVFVTGGNSVFALDKTTGHELWRTDLGPQAGISSAPSVAENTVYVGGAGLFALRVSDGHLRWSAHVGVGVSTPAIANNRVFVNSIDPLFGLWAFDATTGALLWRNEKPGEPESTLTVANGVIFDIAEFGDLMMFNSATGDFLGSFVDPDGHQSQPRFGRPQPAVVNGTVYYPTSDRVDAFRLPSVPGGVPTGTCVYQKIPVANLGSANGINDIGAIVGTVFQRVDDTDVGFLFFNGKTTTFRFPGSDITDAFGINNHAQIVGGAFFRAAGKTKGFVVRGGAFHLIAVPTSQSNNATAINDNGDIVGDVITKDGVQKSYFLHNGTFHIFRFPGSTETHVRGINTDGVIVGYYHSGKADFPLHGFMVTNGVFRTVDFPGAQSTFLTGINNGGDIVGTYSGTDGLNHGFSFENGNFRGLNDPPKLQESMAVGVNNHDEIVTSDGFIGDCRAVF